MNERKEMIERLTISHHKGILAVTYEEEGRQVRRNFTDVTKAMRFFHSLLDRTKEKK